MRPMGSASQLGRSNCDRGPRGGCSRQESEELSASIAAAKSALLWPRSKTSLLPFLTCDAPADRARVRSSESITRANPRVYRVGAAFGRERLICACAPCGGELGDRAKQPKIGYASAE